MASQPMTLFNRASIAMVSSKQGVDVRSEGGSDGEGGEETGSEFGSTTFDLNIVFFGVAFLFISASTWLWAGGLLVGISVLLGWCLWLVEVGFLPRCSLGLDGSNCGS